MMTKQEDLFPLYIIILNWNLPDDTISCIESVQSSLSLTETAILVVDNGSTDDSVSRLTEHFGQTIEIIQNEKNLGFAAGVNIGIRIALEAGAQSILLLNNDTIVDKAMASELVASAQTHPKVGLFGPLIFYHQAPTRIWRFGDNEHPWLPIPLKIADKVVEDNPNAAFKVDYITFCGGPDQALSL